MVMEEQGLGFIIKVQFFKGCSFGFDFLLSRLKFLLLQYFISKSSSTIKMERLARLQQQLGIKQLQYTTKNGCLTLQQRIFYEENGFIIIRNFLKQNDIQRWKQRFLQYCNGSLSPLSSMQIVRDISLVKKNKNVKMKGQANITKLQNFQLDPILQSYCTNPELIPYLKSFCGDNIKSIHTIFLNKPPGMGSSSRHPLHQDLAYFPMAPANRIVAAWAALEDSTKENGGLNFIPKSHRGQFYEHGYPDWNGQVNKAYFGITEYNKLEGSHIDLQMKKGDIVFFHPLLIHGSSENKTQGYRKSICCHFASSQCEFIPIEGAIQDVVSKQVMSYVSKKLPYVTDYYSYCRLKCSLVTGRSFEGKI